MSREAVFARPAALFAQAQIARVVSLNDPDSLNRVQVRLVAFDAVDGQDAPLWARVVCPFAGDDRGAFWMPDVDDEVLVVFACGDPRHPLVLGGLWNGSAAAPASIGSSGNQTKRLRSRNGITVTMEDQDGQEQLTLETPGGQKLTLKDGPGSVKIEDSNGNSVTLETAGITVQASAKVTVQAAQVAVSAGMVQVDAGMSKFSGVVKCDVLMATTVVASTYTPGAGNIW
jgi:uncharacterized protein involved in type VI secretion and phage assembly